MSDAILLTGKRGNGKSLGALSLMQRYIDQGRIVATNLDIKLEHLARCTSKVVCYRLPDWPKAEDLENLPSGNDDVTDEEKNGLLVLDEMATFLGSRDWQGKDRQALINWLVQSRKFGWDLLLIAQHPRLIDAAIRDSLVEIQGQCRRLDKVRVPVLGPFWKWLTGQPLRFPKVHLVTLFYGFQPNAPIWDRWLFKGSSLWPCYDTRQKISGLTGNQNLFTYLPAWHLKGRYMSKWDMYKGYILLAASVGLLVGLGSGYVAGNSKPEAGAVVTAAPEVISSDVSVIGAIADDSRTQVILSSGRHAVAAGSKADKDGFRYLVDGTWYKVAK